MRYAYSAEQIRTAEAAVMADLSPGTLMARAATALARRIAQLLGRVYGARVVLLVGGGNNGADALWAGAFLARRGAAVTALLTAAPDDVATAALR
ncbi:MAG: bifunctional ADP-dependent NAD(P)H-hydrate dehydratase/NAD(P)H-hydrate epimerase, partial [Actinomycetota bacterium]|nr:bifunctional ADP-dependent NAD(P)H-hydrate dehydratase/NAD(P)H-hydrate epimerase [Actinomycetota bacterium]